MRIITCNLPVSMIARIKSLVGPKKSFPSRCELIRVAVREFLIMEIEAGKKFLEIYKSLPQDSPETETPEMIWEHIAEKLNLEREEPESEFSGDSEYKSEFQKDFEVIKTPLPLIAENSGCVVATGRQLMIDGKVWNLK